MTSLFIFFILSPSPLDSFLVHHGASTNSHMVALGENPGIEVRRHVVANVHLCSVLQKKPAAHGPSTVKIMLETSLVKKLSLI